MSGSRSDSSTALLCVGSGLARRYLADTLRALALPENAVVQFRYREELLPALLKAKLLGETRSRPVLMGHVDCTTPVGGLNGACRIVPYREAKLIACRQVGSFVVLTLRLGQYRIAGDLNAFQSKVGNLGPHWEQAGAEAKLVGFWCQELQSALEATRHASGLKDREMIVDQFRRQPDFKNEKYFYFVEGIYERQATLDAPPVRVIDGEYYLRGGSTYELRIVHLAPRGEPMKGFSHELVVQLSNPPLTARTNSTLQIDSPYDAHSLMFTTTDAALQQHGSISIARAASRDDSHAETAGSSNAPEIYLPLVVDVKVLSILTRILLLGALLTSTQLAPLLLKEGRSPWLVPSVIALGFLTSIFVVLGLKKSL